MEFWAKVIVKTVAAVASLVDATNLRTRLYELKEEHELMWTALDDIKRIHKDTPAGKLAERTLEKIKTTYGRY